MNAKNEFKLNFHDAYSEKKLRNISDVLFVFALLYSDEGQNFEQ